MILMQENRSFDHYFGSLRGVIGFGDRATITLPGGLPVWRQPSTIPGLPVTSTQFPWRLADAPPSAYPAHHQPPTLETGAQGYAGTPHEWDDQHAAWFGGWMTGWQAAKGGRATLGYLDRRDIPFQYALADAYTVGDAYYCSALSATGPNRTYLWSGTINADRRHGTFVASCGGDELGRRLPWQTYAETLQAAGVTWKIYQGSDNFGDNGAEYFAAFAQFDLKQGGTPAPGNVLYDNGVAIVPESSTAAIANADNLAAAIRADVLAGTLPQVSCVVTNQTFSEHPDGAPADGAYYVYQVLQSLNADPDVFNSTLVIINYDENDGQFDHVPPPTAPTGTPDEFHAEISGSLASAGVTQPLPVGLGFRVPLLLVSPWTRGGWVTSEVFDHTSVIQFLEKWTTAIGVPAICPNISAWRRSLCGDLTGAFDFANPVYGLPHLPVPGPPIGEPPGGSYHPVPVTSTMPAQEPGTRPARPLPCQPNASLTGFTLGPDGALTARLSVSNSAPHVSKASHFSVYDNLSADPNFCDYPAGFPGQYTVEPSRDRGQAVPASAEIAAPGHGRYDLTIVGPNRFLRRFTGDVAGSGATAQVTATYYQNGREKTRKPRPQLFLTLTNGGAFDMAFTVTQNNYSARTPATFAVPAGGAVTYAADPVSTSGGWYDVTVTISSDSAWSQRFTGHLETGENSISGS